MLSVSNMLLSAIIRFWNEPTAYTPESRTEVHQYMSERRKDKAKSPE